MKNNILGIMFLLAVVSMLSIGLASAWVGQSLSSIAKTNNGLYKSTIYGYQTLSVIWNPYKTYVVEDLISVIPTGKVKPNTSYTLIEYISNSRIICIVAGVSSIEGYLNLPATNYAWTTKQKDTISQKLLVVPTNQIDCSLKRFKAYSPKDILFGPTI